MQETQEAGKVGNKEGTLITSRKKNEKKKHRIRDNIMAKTSGYIHKG